MITIRNSADWSPTQWNTSYHFFIWLSGYWRQPACGVNFFYNSLQSHKHLTKMLKWTSTLIYSFKLILNWLTQFPCWGKFNARLFYFKCPSQCIKHFKTLSSLCMSRRDGERDSIDIIPNSVLLTINGRDRATYRPMVIFIYLGISKLTFFKLHLPIWKWVYSQVLCLKKQVHLILSHNFSETRALKIRFEMTFKVFWIKPNKFHSTCICTNYKAF